jgi:hypothetical protein
MRYLYDIMDIPHQLPELEKFDNLHMRHQPIISYWKGGYIFSHSYVSFLCKEPLQKSLFFAMVFVLKGVF